MFLKSNTLTKQTAVAVTLAFATGGKETGKEVLKGAFDGNIDLIVKHSRDFAMILGGSLISTFQGQVEPAVKHLPGLFTSLGSIISSPQFSIAGTDTDEQTKREKFSIKPVMVY